MFNWLLVMPKIILMVFKHDFEGLKYTHKLPISNIDENATSKKRYFDDNLLDSYCFSQNMFRWNELGGKPISHHFQFHKCNKKMWFLIQNVGWVKTENGGVKNMT